MKFLGSRGVRITGLILAALISTILVLNSLSWRQPERVAFKASGGQEIQWPNESGVGRRANQVKTPYIYSIKLGTGSATIAGTRHTKDPRDSQLPALQKAWKESQPTVAIVEGRPSGFLSAIQPVEKFAESGFVMAMAKKARIRVVTWSLDPIEEAEALVKEFPKRLVAIFMIGRRYFADLRFGKPSDPNAVIAAQITKFGTYPSIAGEITSESEWDKAWQTEFPDAKDWRETSDEFGLPSRLEVVALASRRLRNQHAIQIMVSECELGERVFWVGGLNHAIRLEPVLKKISTTHN